MPTVARLLNEEYGRSHGFIPLNEERILSEIRKRSLKVLVAIENHEVVGLIGTHTHAEERFEERILWLAAREGTIR